MQWHIHLHHLTSLLQLLRHSKLPGGTAGPCKRKTLNDDASSAALPWKVGVSSCCRCVGMCRGWRGGSSHWSKCSSRRPAVGWGHSCCIRITSECMREGRVLPRAGAAVATQAPDCSAGEVSLHTAHCRCHHLGSGRLGSSPS